MTDTADRPGEAAAFHPVVVRQREGGWTPAVQRRFVEALAATGSVGRAAAEVGMSRQGAYLLRNRPGGEGFAAAWDSALARAAHILADTLFERALHGHDVPVFYRGDRVGTRTIHYEKLALYMLARISPAALTARHHDPRVAERLPRLLDALESGEALTHERLDAEEEAELDAMLSTDAACDCDDDCPESCDCPCHGCDCPCHEQDEAECVCDCEEPPCDCDQCVRAARARARADLAAARRSPPPPIAPAAAPPSMLRASREQIEPAPPAAPLPAPADAAPGAATAGAAVSDAATADARPADPPAAAPGPKLRAPAAQIAAAPDTAPPAALADADAVSGIATAGTRPSDPPAAPPGHAPARRPADRAELPGKLAARLAAASPGALAARLAVAPARASAALREGAAPGRAGPHIGAA